MIDPDGKPYHQSEEQIEASKYAMEGRTWGNAFCANCKHSWVAVYFPKDLYNLECPECGFEQGAATKDLEHL